MHVFFEEIGTFVAPVTVEHSEVAAARPPAFEIGFGDVHDYGNPIFVVVFDQAVEGIDGIAFDSPVRSFYEFYWFQFWHDWPLPLFLKNHSIIFNDYYLNYVYRAIAY